jgi:hypothetical protein
VESRVGHRVRAEIPSADASGDPSVRAADFN